MKCPRGAVDIFDKKLFKVEKGGWDHEHCDGCGGAVGAGDSFWWSKSRRLICNGCYAKLSKAKKAKPRIKGGSEKSAKSKKKKRETR